jgi:hypothetical protein
MTSAQIAMLSVKFSARVERPGRADGLPDLPFKPSSEQKAKLLDSPDAYQAQA